MFFCIPSIVYGGIRNDSLIMDKIFSYRRNFSSEPMEESRNIYMKFIFQIKRRNPTLLLVPTLYNIARGEREFTGEMYGKISFKNIKDFDIKRQLEVSTIPHHSRAMPMMVKYVVPDFYGVSLFQEFLLSPFHGNNKSYYKYNISRISTKHYLITFRPKVLNTQLVTGFAIADSNTGRLIIVKMSGEHDMIKFNLNANMGDSETNNSVIPKYCVTDAKFNFLGNRLSTQFTAYYDMDKSLPDTMRSERDMAMISELRPIELTETEKRIYMDFYNKHISNNDSVLEGNGENATEVANSESMKKNNTFKKIAWDVVGDHMLNSMGAETSNAYIRFSPLFNPLYFSYSGSHGLSYKMNIGAEYRFSRTRKISLNPRLGYNFKINQFYFEIPLRYTFNSKRNGWVELSLANGNRITNSAVLDMLKSQYRDTVDFSSLELDYFKDTHIGLTTNIKPVNSVELSVGLLYYKRTAVNKFAMAIAGKPTVYRSFAPTITLKYQPTLSWPVFSVLYERSLQKIFKSNTEYEKFEFDASYKKTLNSLRKVNARFGGGFYTNRSNSYFVDFTNFHENYLQGGWDDDWTGEFQLLNSQWYNASKYYIRTNISYESPLLLLNKMPLIGKHLETERIYGGFVQLEHTRPYFELGYGFTTRYVSIGLFTNLLNGQINEYGCKFTIELFRKW